MMYVGATTERNYTTDVVFKTQETAMKITRFMRKINTALDYF